MSSLVLLMEKYSFSAMTSLIQCLNIVYPTCIHMSQKSAKYLYKYMLITLFAINKFLISNDIKYTVCDV